MRTYGRLFTSGFPQWQQVDQDANGNPDSIYITTLIQCFKLIPGESPFYAQYGIPAHQTLVTQLFPDFYAAQLQQLFAPYFASLTITRVPDPTRPHNAPVYNVQCLFRSGAQIVVTVVAQIMVDGFGNPIVDGFGNPVILKYLTGKFIPV